jgi:hypothetical protein
VNLTRPVAAAVLVVLSLTIAAKLGSAQNEPSPSAPRPLHQQGATFSVPDARLPEALSIIVYGDMRFTDPANTKVANPQARRFLVDKVAAEHPDALVLTGDVPYAGGKAADYDEFRSETAAWRSENLRVYPALGNHELVGLPEQCLNNWWAAFPQLNGRRWYSVQLGSRVYLIDLDSNSDLSEESDQMFWLRNQIARLPKSVDFVFFALHHPAVADKQTLTDTDHNPRPNEIALRNYVSSIAPQSHAQFIVATGHIHNYERLIVGGVTYLVSGGGGARPSEVERGPEDLYPEAQVINFHYILFHLHGKDLQASMVRLADPAAQTPEWQVRDTFVIRAR